MKRRDGWEARLQGVFSNFIDKPFEYGSHDCALFVCNCVREMTGDDPALGYRKRFRDRKGALKILSKSKLESIATQIAISLNAKEIPPLYAQRGDVVLLDATMGDCPALGIVDLTGETIRGAGTAGLVAFPLSEARRAWRI